MHVVSIIIRGSIAEHSPYPEYWLNWFPTEVTGGVAVTERHRYCVAGLSPRMQCLVNKGVIVSKT